MAPEYFCRETAIRTKPELTRDWKNVSSAGNDRRSGVQRQQQHQKYRNEYHQRRRDGTTKEAQKPIIDISSDDSS
eukprot:CAMPEP_0172494568 /NCGR_PEP_ID=MMETSP1066-20121228/51223_1 /TAXON_ID=671091 /ORGANISM="Coscinodiscus wailesii, Strain CCMP2513" /LENGTH=74 /DNA_ID=CAMNT_0013265643 /DNA_START=29 /DNA_END=250 /DNA_ORIENTATION=+